MYGFYQSRQEDITCQITLNNCFPPHLHKQIEIMYMLDGSLRSMVDGNEAVLYPGDLSICFPNLIHSTESIGESKAILIIFDAEFVDAFANELLKSSPQNPFVKKEQISDIISSSIKMILKTYTNMEDIRIPMGYMHVMLASLFPDLLLIESKKADMQDACHLILEYIDRHFTEDISLDSLSKALGISKYYISHTFSNKIRTSFPSYLNRCRIDHAKNLLRNTNDSVTEISFNSGFNSTRTFYRAFREYYGISPKEYRKTHFINNQ